jgi:hypothetical protein
MNVKSTTHSAGRKMELALYIGLNDEPIISLLDVSSSSNCIKFALYG